MLILRDLLDEDFRTTRLNHIPMYEIVTKLDILWNDSINALYHNLCFYVLVSGDTFYNHICSDFVVINSLNLGYPLFKINVYIGNFKNFDSKIYAKKHRSLTISAFIKMAHSPLNGETAGRKPFWADLTSAESINFNKTETFLHDEARNCILKLSKNIKKVKVNFISQNKICALLITPLGLK